MQNAMDTNSRSLQSNDVQSNDVHNYTCSHRSLLRKANSYQGNIIHARWLVVDSRK